MNSKPLNVLLADDDLDDCAFFKKALEELPVSTNLHTVRNGEQLFNYLSEHSPYGDPDILFLDISMPGKTGIECLSEIKESLTLKNMPVAMFTISFPYNPEFETNMKNMLSTIGAEHYISKSPDFEKLKKAIHDVLIQVAQKKLLKEKEQQLSPSKK